MLFIDLVNLTPSTISAWLLLLLLFLFLVVGLEPPLVLLILEVYL